MLINESLLLILFCFLIGIVGVLLVYMPSTKYKKNKRITLVYSFVFLIIGVYLVFNQKNDIIVWKEINDRTYSAKMNTFQRVIIFLLEENTYKLFISQEDKLIKQYRKLKQKCEKKTISDKEIIACSKIINSFERSIHPGMQGGYYVLCVETGNRSFVYLLNKISEKIEIEKFYFRIF